MNDNGGGRGVSGLGALDGGMDGSDPLRVVVVERELGPGFNEDEEVVGGSSELRRDNDNRVPSENSVMAPTKSAWIVSNQVMN